MRWICEVAAQSLRSGPHARVSGHCRKSSSMMVVTFRVLGSKRTIAFFSNGVRRVSTQDRQRVNAQVKKSGRCLCQPFADQQGSGRRNSNSDSARENSFRRTFCSGGATQHAPKVGCRRGGLRRPGRRGYKSPFYLARGTRGVMAFRMLANGARSSKVTVFPCRRMPNCCQMVPRSTVTGWEAISS